MTSDTQLIVRDATVTDAAAIARVHVLGWRAAYRGLLPDRVLDNLSMEKRAAFWADVLAKPRDPRQATLVAETGAGVVGFVNSGPSRDTDGAGIGELRAIYLLPERWSTGAGHAMHEACIESLNSAGFTAATLWVLEGNARALNFYMRHRWSRRIEDGAV